MLGAGCQWLGVGGSHPSHSLAWSWPLREKGSMGILQSDTDTKGDNQLEEAGPAFSWRIFQTAFLIQTLQCPSFGDL